MKKAKQKEEVEQVGFWKSYWKYIVIITLVYTFLLVYSEPTASLSYSIPINLVGGFLITSLLLYIYYIIKNKTIKNIFAIVIIIFVAYQIFGFQTVTKEQYNELLKTTMDYCEFANNCSSTYNRMLNSDYECVNFNCSGLYDVYNSETFLFKYDRIPKDTFDGLYEINRIYDSSIQDCVNNTKALTE
jgi:hypothetical protein